VISSTRSYELLRDLDPSHPTSLSCCDLSKAKHLCQLVMAGLSGLFHCRWNRWSELSGQAVCESLGQQSAPKADSMELDLHWSLVEWNPWNQYLQS